MLKYKEEEGYLVYVKKAGNAEEGSNRSIIEETVVFLMNRKGVRWHLEGF